MDVQKRFELIKNNTEEIMTEEDLKLLLDSGTKIKVPLFVNIGDEVRVNTETGEYVERAK